MNTADPTPSPSSRRTQGEQLIRSRREIIRLFQQLKADGTTLMSEIRQPGVSEDPSAEPDELLLVTQVLQVESETGGILVSWSPSKTANTAVLARRRVRFHGSHQGERVECSLANPREVTFDARPALQFDLPVAVLILHRRRHERLQLPRHIPMWCKIEMPGGTIRAEITDVSLGGIGTIIHESGLHLRPGTILPRATILHSGFDPITVGLTVRHTTPVRQPDGTRTTRIGCSFVGRSEDLQKMIAQFVIELNKDDNSR